MHKIPILFSILFLLFSCQQSSKKDIFDPIELRESLHQVVELMTANQWTYDGANGDTWDNFFLFYGLGMHRLTNKEKADVIFEDWEMVGHPGIAYGLLSDLYFNRSKKSGVVFITNGSKKDFAYGVESTFYQVEEEVFKVIAPVFK